MMTMIAKAVLLAGTILMIAAPSSHATSVKKIGILTFSDENRYTVATKGFTDRLRKAGFKEPGVRFIRENAGASKVTASKLAQKFAAEKMDLIFTLGTSATVLIAREIKDVPIVFSTVYDPVEAGIAKDWASSGNNTTGTSPIVPMSKLLDSLTAFAEIKKLAVLYTPGEKNSETQLKDLQKTETAYRIRVMPVILAKKEDIPQMLPEILRTTDALYITGSNFVNSQVSVIVEMATRARVPTITHLEDMVKKGVLIGVCSDSYLDGYLAGEKAVKILKGAKPASIPIEATRKFHVLFNASTAKAGQFSVTPEFKKTVARVIE